MMQYASQTPLIEAIQDSAAQVLARPNSVFLAEVLEARIKCDSDNSVAMPLPQGVERDLRPVMPNAGRLALGMYMNRKVVESYPLMYTTIALAHPN